MNELKSLQALGFKLPGPGYLFGALLFGIIGWAAYRYGKKHENNKALWLGVALMVYPYVVSQTWLLYAVGAGLCVGLYLCSRS
jgi:hypothetical protein